MKKLYLFFLLTVIPLLAHADAVEINGIYYNLVADAKIAEVTSNPNKYSGDIIIPEKVTYDGVKYDVTSIGDAAFESCTGLTSVTIPNGVTSISGGSFWNCQNLNSIDIPSTVISIGKQAFYGCSSLTSVTIPSSVTSIAPSTFEGCSNLSTIEIPKSVTSIGLDAFSGTTWLNNQPNGLLYVGKVLYAYIGNMPDNTNISIDEGTISIVGNAFKDCKGLVSVAIPNSVTSIGLYAFMGCSNLSSIEIPNSVVYIDDLTFHGCSALISVTIPNSVTSIGHGAFENCTGLASVTIPNSVTFIGAEAFCGCSNLATIEIPNSVTSINYLAFGGCTNLSSITCLAVTPPLCDFDSFGNHDIPLYVPDGSIDSYKAANEWKRFKEIWAIEPYVEPSTIMETPLTFEAVNGTVQISFSNHWSNSTFSFKYSIDNGPWKDYEVPIDGLYSLPESGKIVRLMSKNETSWLSEPMRSGSIRRYLNIKCDADCYIYGNIMSLVKGEAFATNSNLDDNQKFGALFRNNTHLKNHPEKSLVLPSKTLNLDCYLQMFSGCTGLTKAPELPATVLEKGCYQEMFKGCSNINEVVCKAVDISAEGCTTNWLDGVSATGTFYKDATMTDWTEGVNGIPTGWTVKDFNTKVEKDDVVYTPNDEDHTVTVNDGGASKPEIVIQANISINGQNYEVTAIGDCAFQNNELVVKVTIPETIASIGAKAFAGCKNLKSICIYVKVPINLPGAAASRTRGDGGSSVFAGVDTETCVLYVPAGSADAYRNADGWKEFKNIVEIPLSASIKVAKGMTTYTSEHNLDFSSLGDDVKAYVATGYDYDNGTIWLTRVKDVPAGTPILVQAPASETPYDVPVKASSGCYYKNMLVGNLSGGDITLSATTGDMTNYYLSNGKFLTATGSNTIGNGKAYLQIPTTPPAANVGSSQSVKLNDYGFASFCGSQDLDFTDVEGLKAFAVTGYDDANGTIWLTRVKRVSAQTPLLLKGDSKGSYSVPSVAVGSYYANMMKGNLSGSTITIYTTDGDMTNYYLKGNQLLKATDGGNTIGNGKAYMQIPSKHVTRSMEDMIADLLMYGISEDEPEVISIPVVNARGLNGDGTTGIHSIENGESENDVYYNLQGQRVDNPTKGIYIRNGKKVVIK